MKYPERIRITKENVESFPTYHELLRKNVVKFDSRGILRYLHGAPVGELILVRINNDGTPKYKESANEWFDPESQKAKEFIWP